MVPRGTPQNRSNDSQIDLPHHVSTTFVYTPVQQCKLDITIEQGREVDTHSAAFCAVMIGYDSAFIGGTIALPAFQDEFGFAGKSTHETNLISENIVSLYQAGAFFGAFFAYAAGHYLGRKKGLQIFATVFILGAGLMLGANKQRGLGLIYGGRVLAGIGVGGASVSNPHHTLEVSR